MLAGFPSKHSPAPAPAIRRGAAGPMQAPSEADFSRSAEEGACFRAGGPRPRVHGRPGSPSTPGPEAGFTLVELLVVLALLALVAGLAFPNLEQLYAGAVRSTERAYILDQFAGLGRRAMQQGRAYVVVGSGDASRTPAGEADEPGPAPRRPAGFALPAAARADHAANVIDLPDGWEIAFDEPLLIRANGVCLGAELTLRHLGEVDVRLRLDPPFCRVAADA